MNVSVICPVFNTHPDLLMQAVTSVLENGTSHELELILVDDCSTDSNTVAMVRQLASSDRRVVLIYQLINGGPARARSAGLARATYDWIGFIDSDDLWPPAKLDTVEAELQGRPDTRWISGDFSRMCHDGELRPSRHFIDGGADSGSIRCESPDLTRRLIGGWLPLGVSVVQRELLVEAGGFDPALTYGEDWLLFIRLSLLSPMVYIKYQAYLLRRQGASMMRSPGVMSYKLVQSGLLARRDLRLRPFLRELRWWRYRTFKDIAMNNALNGQNWWGAFFAIRALLVDPREVGELMLYLRLTFTHEPALADNFQRYSKAEQVVLARVAEDESRLLGNNQRP